MNDWNVVITVEEDRFEDACNYLGNISHVSSTDYYNVVVMRVESIPAVMERIRRDMEGFAELASIISRVVPLRRIFEFNSQAEFEQKAAPSVRDWVPQLEEKSFYVRMHRRGFRGDIKSEQMERRLGEIALEALQERGSTGEVDFDNPDAVISVETVGQRGGLSLWTREELDRYPFLELD